MRPDYTIRLEHVFQGPMDLLLHLVREQEVEIHEIEIAKILEGYLAYLQSLEKLDIEYAADFLVMAATLMAIKSRSLLSSDEIDLEQELDPKDELIQRLLEYRRFKEASEFLDESRRLRERMAARGWHGELGLEPPEREFDLGELTSFDLLATYSRLMRETLADRPHRIAIDARPLRYYVEQIVLRLKRTPRATLESLVASFEPGHERETLVGSFCALLELVRLEAIEVAQPAPRAEIEVRVRSDLTEDLETLVGRVRFDEEQEPDPAASDSAPLAGDARGPDEVPGNENGL